MSGHAKIPATVITGFLGAGKTSLLRHLIANAGRRRLALVINEFGELGVDGEMLKACGIEGCSDDNLIELANGCICCTVADDFLPTIQRLLDRPDPPEHILIETSGLALPKPLVQAFNWPEVRTRVTVDGVITVIDGAAVVEGRFAANPEALAAQRAADPELDHDSPLEELFEDQLQCADLIVVNKTDLLPPEGLSDVHEAITRHRRQAAKVVGARFGQVDPRVLLGIGAAAEDDLDGRPSHHDGEEGHDHEDFASFVVEFGEIASPETLVRRLAAAVAAHDVLRIKGFVAVSGKPMRLVLQGVGARLQHYYDRDWSAGEPRRSRLVVIGQQGIDADGIRSAIGDGG